MNDEQLSGLFRSVDLSGEPAVAPDEVRQLVAVGRRSVRRRRLVTTLAVTLVLVLVGVLVGTGAVPPRHRGLLPAGPPARPSVPDRVAPFSFRTGTVSDSPAGRAVLIYKYGSGELFNVWQSLALGADRDTYRHIDAASEGYESWLLSADGRYVVLASNDRLSDQLTVVDLTTGAQRRVPLGGRRATALLTASPDGRYVAFSSAASNRDLMNGEQAMFAQARGTLHLLELTTGRDTEVPAVSPATAAAFAPDGRSIAVQSGSDTSVYTLDGQRRWRVPMDDGQGLLPRVAWSPDGRLLATIRWESYPDSMAPTWTEGEKVVFVTADGGNGPVPAPLTVSGVDVLGWRSGDRIVALRGDIGDGYDTISELPLDGGPPRVLSRFDRSHTCEYWTQPCMELDVSAATALLPELTVRRGDDPDRGLWPLRVRLTALSAVLLAGLVTALVVRRVRRRRRRRLLDTGPLPPLAGGTG